MTSFELMDTMHSRRDLYPLGRLDQMTMQEAKDLTIEAMYKYGYVWWENGTHQQAMELRNILGKHVYTTDVKAKESSKAMLSKMDTIGPHTDHHDVDFVLWYVHQHCKEGGGETHLYRFQDVLDTCAEGKGALQWFHPKYRSLKCKEHKVFDDDPGEHLVIQRTGGRKSIFRNLETNLLDVDKQLVYYSFWLADHKDDPDVQKWFKRFHDCIVKTEPFVGFLPKQSIFIFDNRLNLHARTSYSDPARHLERHWIKAVL